MEERQCEARIMHRGYIYTEEKILLSLVTGIIRFSMLVISRFEIMPVPRHEIYIYTYTCTRLFKYLRSRSYIISARFHDEKDIYLLYEDNVNNLFLPVISI